MIVPHFISNRLSSKINIHLVAISTCRNLNPNRMLFCVLSPNILPFKLTFEFSSANRKIYSLAFTLKRGEVMINGQTCTFLWLSQKILLPTAEVAALSQVKYVNCCNNITHLTVTRTCRGGKKMIKVK